MRLKELEKLVIAHLQESGEIREGIKGLQAGYETLSGRLWAVVVLSMTTLLAVCGFLIKVLLWK